MKFVAHIIFICWIQTVFSNILLFKINDRYSIYITNKSRSIIHQPKPELIANDGEMISLLYSNERYVIVGQVDKIYNISSTGSFEELVVENRQEVVKLDCWNVYNCKNYIRAAFLINPDKGWVTCGTTDSYCQYNGQLIRNHKKINLLFYSTYLMPHQIIQNKPENNNIAPFTYYNSVYYFHATRYVVNMFKQTYELNKQEIVFGRVVQLPDGAIKSANFRTSYGFEDKVYTFFSEKKTTHHKDVVYTTFESYIGEVCAEDRGKFSHDLTKRFVSFKKININCYLPDYVEMAHTKFTEIQQATKPIQVLNEKTGNIDHVIYAVFTTRRSNEIDSAVCMFELSNVKRSMSGLFKNDQDKFPLKPLQSCSEYQNQTPSQIDVYTKNISRHSKYEMDEILDRKAFFALKNIKFSSIASDFKNNEHILYIGTAEGRLLKVINKPPNEKRPAWPIILSDLQIFNNESIVNIIVSDQTVILIGETQIKKINIEKFCETMTTCADCLNSEDPDCSWTVKGCALKQLGYEQGKCLISQFDFSVSEQKNSTSLIQLLRSSVSSVFVTFLLTFVITSILTCLIVYYFIKNNYKLIEKSERDEDSGFLNFFTSRNFRQTLSVKKKLLTKCYETQPVVCVSSRPESTSDSPFILTPSSTESNSPNFSNNKDLFADKKQFKDTNLIQIC